MNVSSLNPLPTLFVQFAWSSRVSAPSMPGCYALATFSGVVLYVGRASVSILTRMEDHLKSTEKCKGTAEGVPFWLYYVQCPANEIVAIERGWMNQSILEDGALPPLNKIYGTV